MNWREQKKEVIPERVVGNKKKRKGSTSNEWIDEKRKKVIPERVVGKKVKEAEEMNELMTREQR